MYARIGQVLNLRGVVSDMEQCNSGSAFHVCVVRICEFRSFESSKK